MHACLHHDKLIVAVSSRALFDFEEANRVFETESAAAYMQYQLDRQNEVAPPGVAFPLVCKLLAFNTPQRQFVEVVVLSRNDPVSGLRVFHSVQAYPQLKGIERGVFTRGANPFHYLRPFGAHLFLSANAQDVKSALEIGFPAAQVGLHAAPPAVADTLTTSRPQPHAAQTAGAVTPAAESDSPTTLATRCCCEAAEAEEAVLRIAFDGDSVLFGDEGDRAYQQLQLDGFHRHEVSKARQPLPEGPFKPFLQALQKLYQASLDGHTPMHLRTALVTARSAPAHERVIRTLMAWDLPVDEALFLGGLAKGPFLREFAPDFFFDDQNSNVLNAISHGHAAGLVPMKGAGHGSDSTPVMEQTERQ